MFFVDDAGGFGLTQPQNLRDYLSFTIIANGGLGSAKRRLYICNFFFERIIRTFEIRWSNFPGF